jgi:hypothetical protein
MLIPSVCDRLAKTRPRGTPPIAVSTAQRIAADRVGPVHVIDHDQHWSVAATV